MKLTGKKIGTILRQSGYKLTPQRRAVLNVIALSDEHLTPVALYEAVRQNCPDIGLVTVYRTLEILTELGFICEVRTGGRQRSFVMRRPIEHHHHLICSACGRVVDFAICDLAELEKKLSRETGFEIDSHLLELQGRCPKCCEEVSAQVSGRM